MHVERFQFASIIVQHHGDRRTNDAVFLDHPEFAAMRAKVSPRLKQMSLIILGVEHTIIFGINASNQIENARHIFWNSWARIERIHLVLRFSETESKADDR